MSRASASEFCKPASRIRVSSYLGLIRRTERRTRLTTAAVGVALTIIAGAFALSRMGGAVTSLGYDLPFAFRRAGASTDIRLVLLDKLDGDAIDRRDQAKLLRRLKEVGVRAVLYDLIFDRPSRDPAVDLDFAAAMREFRGVSADAPPDARGSRFIFLACEREANRQAGVFEQKLRTPADVLLDAADDFGLVALVHEDYRVRELNTGDRDEASMTWKAAMALGANLKESERLVRRWVNFAGPPGTISACGATEVLGEVDPSFLRGKVVIVGSKPGLLGAAAGQDLFSTPFHLFHRSTLPLMGGAEVQANLLSSLWRGDFLTRFSPREELLIVLVFGVAVGTILAWLRPLRAVVVACAAVLVLMLAGVLAVHFGRVWFAWTVPAFVQLPVALAWGTAANFYVERYFRLKLSEEQRRLREAFKRYLSPQMLDRLTAEGFDIKLGGQRTTAAMMFTDLEGFTDMCQRVGNPESIVATLNDYFQRTTRHIFENDGMIMRFAGDSIFGSWGVPFEDKQAASKAVRAAWRLHESARLVVDGDELRTRVGVHISEDVVAGNVGSDQHIDYTLVGDAVNLASRLEGLNKMFGTSILVSGEVKGQLGAAWRTRRIGCVCVKGRTDVTVVHELLGPAAQVGEPAWITKYHAALTALESEDLVEARRFFSEANSIRKNGDSASRFFIERLDAGEQFSKGVIELKEK